MFVRSLIRHKCSCWALPRRQFLSNDVFHRMRRDFHLVTSFEFVLVLGFLFPSLDLRLLVEMHHKLSTRSWFLTFVTDFDCFSAFLLEPLHLTTLKLPGRFYCRDMSILEFYAIDLRIYLHHASTCLLFELWSSYINWTHPDLLLMAVFGWVEFWYVEVSLTWYRLYLILAYLFGSWQGCVRCKELKRPFLGFWRLLLFDCLINL